METVKILFLTKLGEGLVGAPQTYHEFEQAVGKITECKWAGEGWGDYKQGESMDETVQRVMPDCDWVIAEKNNTWSLPEKRDYRVGVFLSDIHGKHNLGIGTPDGFFKLVDEAGFDAVFLKYLEIHARASDPHLFKKLHTKVYHLPWSVDVNKHRWERKRVDVSFIGSHEYNIYPIRSEVWNELQWVSKGYGCVLSPSPRGKTYSRKVDDLKDKYYVGDRYIKLLNQTKIMIFDSSIYRYPVQKYFESMASACLVLSDEPSTAKELGFVDGETYIKISTGDWKQKLKECLTDYDSFKHVARNGLRNIVLNHCHEIRAKQFLEMLQ